MALDKRLGRLNQLLVEVLLVLALFVPTDEKKGLAFIVEVVEDPKDVSLGPSPDLLEVPDRATLQGIGMRPP
jgi:hypothetical protein